MLQREDLDRTNAERSENETQFADHSLSTSYVYFILAENGLVKIGFASNFRDRSTKLAMGSSGQLYPLAAVQGGRVEERAYHERFKAHRHHGEWFYLTDEIEAEIDRLGYEGNRFYRPYYQRGYAFPLTLTQKLAAVCPE